jgi:hypothetical protein
MIRSTCDEDKRETLSLSFWREVVVEKRFFWLEAHDV